MRVAILGPSISENVSGGVAVFDEGLFNGFKENGDEVFLISANKSTSIDNITILQSDISQKNVVFHLNKIARILEKIKPDLVISSLQYSIGIKKYKRKHKNCTYVQVLHGFPCEINGIAKARLINLVARYTRKHFDYVVAVSFLSYAVNKKIMRIPCDKIIYNGCNFKETTTTKERIYDFVYVGRLFRDKEVALIADAFSLLKKVNPNIRVAIAGYGELEKLLRSKYSNSGIEFLGKVDQNGVQKIFESSKFFVSMNPLEPFGIVFCEALLCGCNIVTQSSSGCAPIFIKNDYFHIVDCITSSDLCDRLLEAYNSFYPLTQNDFDYISKFSSFKRVALEYSELLKK